MALLQEVLLQGERVYIYHMSNCAHECMGVNGKALQSHAVHKKLYFFLLQVTQESLSVLQKSHNNLYQVLQVTHVLHQEFVAVRVCNSHMVSIHCTHHLDDVGNQQ